MIPRKRKLNIIRIADFRPDANIDARVQPAEMFHPGAYFDVRWDD
jgi:hypothetical protein